MILYSWTDDLIINSYCFQFSKQSNAVPCVSTISVQAVHLDRCSFIYLDTCLQDSQELQENRGGTELVPFDSLV